MQLRIFTNHDAEALETQVNEWLQEKGATINVDHTETAIGNFFDPDTEEPLREFIVTIWFNPAEPLGGGLRDSSWEQGRGQLPKKSSKT
jgi:hypothetical protein